MNEKPGTSLVKQVGTKVAAVGVLVIASWVLFKIVLGFVAALAGVFVVVLALVAILWAVRTL